MESRLLILWLFIATPIFVDAQEEIAGKGLLRGRATFAAGVFTKPLGSTSPIYIQGDLEYYISPSFSIRSDGYYFVRNANMLTMNHQHFTGAAWHPRKGKAFDPFIGFQSGISFAQRFDVFLWETRSHFNPMAGVITGFHFFAPKLFHCSFTAGYVHGNHQDAAAAISLDEIRFSFGLGLHFHLLKNRKG